MTDEGFQKDREDLLARVENAERIANECRGEAAVYRKDLKEFYEAAKIASDNEDVTALNRILSKEVLIMPSESEVKLWGKDFLEAYTIDVTRLSKVQELLKQIKDEAEKLNVEKDSQNAMVKDLIIELADCGVRQ